MSRQINATVFIEGLGLIGPGFTGWPESKALLNSGTNFDLVPVKVPVPDCLPAAERRRVGNQVKLALAVGREAVEHSGQNASQLPNVFTASQGDGDNCHAICEVLAGPDRLISPTRFHNSVHNAAAGYWGIAMKCMAPSTSLCAFDGSFSAGLLEATSQSLSQQTACLLVSSDTPYPEPLNTARPMAFSLAVGMVINPVQSEKSIAKLSLSLTQEAPNRLSAAHWEHIRLSSPSARCLPLLSAIASPDAEVKIIHLNYLSDCSLTIQFEKISL